jgi:hypothetical protein
MNEGTGASRLAFVVNDFFEHAKNNGNYIDKTAFVAVATRIKIECCGILARNTSTILALHIVRLICLVS